MYDFHTHLNESSMFLEWKTYVRRFFEKGGKGLVNIGADEIYNKNALSIAKLYEKDFGPEEKKHFQLGTSIGYHPYEVCKETADSFGEKNIIDEKMKKLLIMYEKNKKYIRCIGECGFDFHYPNSRTKEELQRYLFILHIKFAQKTNLPLVIHSREAFTETLDTLKQVIPSASEIKNHNNKETNLYFHCRGYTPREVEKLLNTFPTAMIGICCNVMYKNANNIRESLNVIPLANLVLETDAPYLPPLLYRGKKNEPSFITFLYEFVSKQKGISLQDLKKQMEKNWQILRKKINNLT